MNALEHQFHAEFAASGDEQWVAAETGRVAGRVRSAGGGGLGAGNVTYVEVFEAGCVFSILDYWCYLLMKSLNLSRHMVPFDQPEAALVCLSALIIFSMDYFDALLLFIGPL